MNIAVCDDEKIILDYLSDIIMQTFSTRKMQVQVVKFYDSVKLMKSLESTFYDVVFLDIDMPNLTGFDVGRVLNKSAKESILIFVSNKESKVFESFQYEPFRFMRKTKFNDEIDAAVDAVIESLEHNTKSITIESSNQIVKLNPYKIIYAEINDKIIKIVSESDIYYIRYKMMDLENQLDGYGFIRINKGCIVNYKYIKNIRKSNEVLLVTGELLPISRRRIKEVIDTFGELVNLC